MAPPEPDTRYQDLVASATELVALLREFQAEPWAELVARGLELIEAGDGHGLDRIVALRGGMGSFSDLVIHPMNRHPIAEDRIDEVNNRLNALRATVLATARSLQRDLDHPSG